MRETRADTRSAVISALALHALLFGLMFLGLWWTHFSRPQSLAGPRIEADLVDPKALAAPLRRALDAPAEQPPEPATPPPQPQPEPKPQEAPTPPQPQAQERIPEPDTVEQERFEREAQAARQAAREQEQKRRQEQIDLTERKRQEQAERKRRLAQQAIDEKIRKIQAAREKAAREADLAEQKLRQLAQARARNAAEAAPPPPGNEGVDDALLAQYMQAISRAVESNWTRPENIPPGAICTIHITQLQGGEVMRAEVDPGCPYDERGRRSIEAAVLKAQPLPYAGFERVFNRILTLHFRPSN